MTLRRMLAGGFTTLLLLSAPGAAQQPADAFRVTRLVGDGMVMQRGKPVPVWGWNAPNAPVTVTFDGRARTTTTGRDSAWKVVLPAMSAGGPHTMTIASAGRTITVSDILVGDVWVASGQSNMEWTVENTKNAAQEISAANDTRIRQFKVPTSWAEAPSKDLAGGTWTIAGPQHVGGFTAVGYFFARDLRKSVDVPIGILHTSWGGSRIEPWMSRSALAMTDAQWSAVMQKERDYDRTIRATLGARLGALPAIDSGLVGGQARWADPALDDNGWRSIVAPKLWEQQGYDGMDGVAWYRTSFTLTEQEAARGARLSLGTIDDNDISWVNGVEVGRTSGYDKPRTYDVPASALRAGRNVVAVRVEDGGGGGGFYGDSGAVYVDVSGTKRTLAGDWKFKVGVVTIAADGQHINKIPTVLYNKMIHPLLPYPIKGALWYQGESNADGLADAIAYRPLFAKLITSWRKEWGVGDFPFLWVQLANFMAPDAEPPAQSAWATLRETQTAALALPKTAQAVIIDIGEEKDIHPRNKQDVGARLALAARKVAYGQSLVASGPMHSGHTIRGNEVTVRFTNVGGGLIARGSSNRVGGFAIAGADHKFVWADARIEGDHVVVSSPSVTSPVAVRYAWGNNPTTANLYNREGLPANPFRTDSW